MKKYSGRILVVDDDEHVVLTSCIILKQNFENIDSLNSPQMLESKLRTENIYVVLLDMNFRAGVTSGNEGIFWMNRIRQLSPHTQVVLQTAYGDIELAVKSIKEGAVDFLPKPWDKEKLVLTMINAYEQAQARKDSDERKSKQRTTSKQIQNPEAQLIANAPSMQPVLQTIEQVAPTDANVLILGENGTGKEMVALAIHQQSNRAHQAFVKIDVGALPATLFEAEMFGHEKGAFTDAKETRIGKLELANKGTLFLDEIGNLSPDLQVKLLSSLQSRTITRLGSNTVVPLDVRVICATNAPLQTRVREGSFRQDLYYRINTVELSIPPLRERMEDILPLVLHYMGVYTRRYNKPLEVSSLDALTRYHWPGNVRELQHATERAVILCREPVLTAKEFQLAATTVPSNNVVSSLNLNDVEKETIRLALERCHYNLTRTAGELGIGRTTLYRKMEEYGLDASTK